MGSDDDVVSGGVGHAQQLEEGGTENDEEKDAEKPRADLRALLLFINEQIGTGGRRDLSRLAL
jgi:hypothetical protein